MQLGKELSGKEYVVTRDLSLTNGVQDFVTFKGRQSRNTMGDLGDFASRGLDADNIFVNFLRF